MTEYPFAKDAWQSNYAWYAAKGRYQHGDSYKNDVERWAKQRKFEILSAIVNDKKWMQQGNICGF